MKISSYKVILCSKPKTRVFSFRSKKLPEINEELLLYYGGAYHFVKVNKVKVKPFPFARVSEIDVN